MSITRLLEQIEKRIDGRLDAIEQTVGNGLNMVHGRISASERRATAEHDEVKQAVSDLGKRVDKIEGVVDQGRGAKALVALVALALAASAVLDRLPV